MSEYPFHYTSMDKAIKINASNTLLFGKLEKRTTLMRLTGSVFNGIKPNKSPYLFDFNNEVIVKTNKERLKLTI